MIHTRLKRTATIAALLKNAEYPSRETVTETIFVITGLLEEAVEDTEELRTKILDQGPPRYG